MKTIGLTAFRRPEYEKRVLQSVKDLNHIDRGYRFFTFHDWEGGGHLGCDRNMFCSISECFDYGSEFHVQIEDDTLLAPDALDLADWFFNHPERDNYVLLNLHAHSKDLSQPLDIHEHYGFTSWGWAITRQMWERWLLPNWGGKHRVHPMGWDWSVSYALRKNGLKTLSPILSRTLNIGREGGTYEIPEHWDTWAKDLVMSPGGFGNGFQITRRIETMPPLEDWVLEELKLEESDATVGEVFCWFNSTKIHFRPSSSPQPVEQLGTHMPAITRLLGEREHLKGDIAEFGVYAGATTFQLADFGRWVWAFDTFEGIPAEDYTPELDRDEPGKFVSPAELYDRLNDSELTIPVKGRFEDTLPKLTVTRGIVLAYLDCDLYKSAQQAFKWLQKHLVEGAVIVLDDYSTHKGIQKAVSEFLRDNPKAEFDGWEVIYWGKP